MEATTAIVLDTRSMKKDETFPLKLRVVYNRSPRMYAISIKLGDGTMVESLTPGDFDKVRGRKPSKDAIFSFKKKETYKEIASQLSIKEVEANQIITKLDNFDFDRFRDVFVKKKGEVQGDPENVFWHFDNTVKRLEANNQLGTASNYYLSCKSLKRFLLDKNSKEPEKLMFKDITVDFLTKYENFMYNEGKDEENGKGGKSATTVSMYLRALRTIFNTAIGDKVIEPDIYPFRRGINDRNKYEIPTGSAVKKALSEDDLKKLFHAKAKTPEQVKAKDFWFFSYTCNGMNMKDICLLRNENLNAESLNFSRAKTRLTKKNQKELRPILTDFAKSVIAKYRTTDPNPKAFAFPILTLADNERTKRKKIQSFTRTINEHIKKIAGSVGITEDISTYFARHSFSTEAIRKGASIEFVSEALGHSDIKTTRGYFAGFADSTKKELGERLMDF